MPLSPALSCAGRGSFSPLKKGEEVEVLSMASEEDCRAEMFVLARVGGRKVGVPLAILEVTAASPDTREAVKDWQYWVTIRYESCSIPEHSMNLASLEAIVRALNAQGVRYLIAGGLAVGAHGYPRLTMDVDLVVHLAADNITAAFRALTGLGYRPLVPVTAQAFSDPAQRERWIQEKGMQVLNFFSDQHKATSVDLFVTEPFDFHAEVANALEVELAPGLVVRFVSIPTLIRMKEAAGRPRDLDDIEHLRWIVNERKQDEPDR